MPPKKQREPAIFQPINYPILDSVDPADAVSFQKERERYELEIAEKAKEGTNMVPASYLISVDPELLRSMFSFGYFDDVEGADTIEDITEEHVKQVITNIASAATPEEPDSAVIESCLAGMRMDTKIRSPKARVFQLAVEFDKRMASTGYGTFKDKNPKMATYLLSNHLYPPALKAQVKNDFNYIPALQTDWKTFLRYVAKQAEHIEKGAASSRKAISNVQHNQKHSTNGNKSVYRPKKNVHTTKEHGEGGNDTKPPCLNPACTEKHLLRYCTNTSADLKKELYAKLTAKKAVAASKKVAKLQATMPDKLDETATLRTIFAGVETRVLCPDIGSDINLMCPSLLNTLLARGASVTCNKFATPRKYDLAVEQDTQGKRIYVECDRQATLNIELLIRHGTSLTLRNVTFHVATRPVKDQLLSRQLLAALGLDAKEMLAAASARFNGDVDVGEILPMDEYEKGSIAHVYANNGLFHSDADDETDDEDDDMELGNDTTIEINDACEKMIRAAIKEGISKKGEQTLRHIISEYKDVLRCRLGQDPPASVEPMRIKLKKGSKPVKTKVRHYSAAQRAYIKSFTERAERFGFIKKYPNSSWAAAPLLVAKPGTNKYRITFDLRPVNACTQPMAWPMPHIPSEFSDMANSSVFASIDFTSGYWQLPADKDTQEAHAFMTPEATWVSLRTLQGGRNSGSNFQCRVQPLFSELQHMVKAWLDDFAIHHANEEGLLQGLEKFLSICRKHGLKVSARKSILFSKTLHWCGRIISASGIQFDPRRLSGLKDVQTPQTAGELSQYVYCIQWMSQAVPDFAARIQPLRDILEAAYAKAGRRTTRAIKTIPLHKLSWGAEHDDSFASIQDSLRNAVTLSHPDNAKETCVFTDASDTHWAAVVTQCDIKDLDKEIGNQRHNPLAFLSSEFKNAEKNWSTFEKEAFAILQVFKKLDYLLLTERPIHVYTDHKNLLFVFNPLSLEPALGRHVVSKVQRWALHLSKFAYTIEHIAGINNVMPDIMTRWLAGYRGKRSAIRRVRNIETPNDIVRSPFDDDFVWPTIDAVRNSQKHHEQSVPKNAKKIPGAVWTMNEKVWIPEQDLELQSQILVIAHCGRSGHRGSLATKCILNEQYYWKTLEDDCKEFVRACIHCLTSRSGERVPRPLSGNISAQRPNEVVHFDFLYLGHGMEGMKYALIIKDDLSSYTWLCPARNANAEVVATEIIRWITTFSKMKVWVSDQGSHFKNAVMKNIAEDCGIKHRFITAYSPWANGTVERCCREVLRTLRAMLSELKLAPQDWPKIINMVQVILNESPVARLGMNEDNTCRTPLQVMTGIRPTRDSSLEGDLRFIHGGDLTRNKIGTITNLDELQKSIENMHKNVSDKVSAERARQIHAHNKHTKVVTPSFTLGDFVLVKRPQEKGHKLLFKWTGPRRVTKILHPLVYEVTGLVEGKTERVHATRMQIYMSSPEEMEASDALLRHAEHSEATYEEAEKLHALRTIGTSKFIQVEWQGLPDVADYTWEPLLKLYEDIPDMVKQFLMSQKQTKLVKEAIVQVGMRI